MKVIAIIVMLLGVASLVLGVLFVVNAGSTEDEVAASVAPLTLDEVDPKYDAVKAKHEAVRAAEEPAIQGGTALPSPMYNYLTAQRGALGLARTNIGLATLTRTLGLLNVIIGAGLVLVSVGMMRKS